MPRLSSAFSSISGGKSGVLRSISTGSHSRKRFSADRPDILSVKVLDRTYSQQEAMNRLRMA
jgi:hypothetical protein